ncbi:MAG TPA: FGGY family carbohydrate kinase [Dehalococcoidia bacterium]|nr:FGGY family carbohydrate kinase [Dehalococcoidia bacterium]
MSIKYVLAIDAGSSGVHVLITDLQGHPVSHVHQEWDYDIPAEVAPLGREFDPAKFWGIICQLIGESIKKSAITPNEIIAVGAASQRQGVVFLDKDGHELYAGPNLDLRALSEGFSIDSEFGNEIYRITGHAPSFMFTPAKLRWFKANHPHIYEQIATVLSISDWIIYRLSGERVGELSSDCDIGLVDIRELKWSGLLMEMLELPKGIYPEITTAGTRVGTVSEAAAEQAGLVPGTSVVTGGADTQCGLLGMGVKDEGQVGVVAGWSGSIQMVTSQPIIDSQCRLWSGCHAITGRWVLESNAGESGGAYRWLNGLIFGQSNRDMYDLMDGLAQEAPPGAGGVLAFTGPMVMDMSRLRPSLGGFIFPTTPTVTNIERKHLVRATIENLCFAFKANCAQLEEVSGLRTKGISIGGGLAQSRCLVQILSDLVGLEVASFEMPQVSSLGTAMCAAVGSGIYDNLGQAMEAMRPVPRMVEPDNERAKEYAQYYGRWISTAKWLEDLNEKWYEQMGC